MIGALVYLLRRPRRGPGELRFIAACLAEFPEVTS